MVCRFCGMLLCLVPELVENDSSSFSNLCAKIEAERRVDVGLLIPLLCYRYRSSPDLIE